MLGKIDVPRLLLIDFIDNGTRLAAADWDGLIINGTIESKKFLAFFVKNEIVVAVAGSGRSRELTTIHEMMRLKKLPFSEDLKIGNIRY